MKFLHRNMNLIEDQIFFTVKKNKKIVLVIEKLKLMVKRKKFVSFVEEDIIYNNRIITNKFVLKQKV